MSEARDRKTVVDSIYGKVDWRYSWERPKTVEGMVEQGCRFEGNKVVRIFREHNEEADVWAGNRGRGFKEEWLDAADFWSDVTGICGFWDRKCRAHFFAWPSMSWDQEDVVSASNSPEALESSFSLVPAEILDSNTSQ